MKKNTFSIDSYIADATARAEQRFSGFGGDDYYADGNMPQDIQFSGNDQFFFGAAGAEQAEAAVSPSPYQVVFVC